MLRCSHDSCINNYYSAKFCRMHYRQFKKYGVTFNKPDSFKCKHKGCSSKKHRSKGYCNKHYQQFMKHGETIDNTQYDFNVILDKGDYYELVLTNIKGIAVGKAKVDREDLEKISVMGRWCLDTNGYVCNRTSGVYMHRVVMNAKAEEIVDHKKVGIRYKLDNRKSNLRLANDRENSYNRKKLATNSSGYKGVYWNESKKKWHSKISLEKGSKHLGYFVNILDAAQAYKKAAKELHKEFYCA